MKILVTGNYEIGYNRTVVILDGLRMNGAEVIEMNYSNKRNLDISLFKKVAKTCDAIFLPSFTHGDVRFIRKLTKTVLVFDPLISKYLTKVYDYKNIKPYSPRALKNYYKDKIALKNADVVLSDTKSHLDYFASTFKISKNKFEVLPIGYPSSHFFPIEKPLNKITRIGFYGSFAPLQGIDKIVDAMHLLKNRNDLVFHIIGGGYDYIKVINKIKEYGINNIVLEDRVAYDKLNEKINSFDICLGIFGDSKKAKIVIPNKIYHYMASGKPVITMESPAIKELFTSNENILLCQNNGQGLAGAISYLLENNVKAKLIGDNGFKLVHSNFTEKEIGSRLIEIIIKHLAIKNVLPL